MERYHRLDTIIGRKNGTVHVAVWSQHFAFTKKELEEIKSNLEKKYD